MEPWWTEDMVYDFNYVGPWNFGATRGLRAWYEGEHLHFNAAIPDCQWLDFIRAATDETATSASYGLARWTGDLALPTRERPTLRTGSGHFTLLSQMSHAPPTWWFARDLTAELTSTYGVRTLERGWGRNLLV